MAADTKKTKEDKLNIDSKQNQKSNNNNESDKKENKQEELGGPKGPEPTRYNDWSIKGRVSDF